MFGVADENSIMHSIELKPLDTNSTSAFYWKNTNDPLKNLSSSPIRIDLSYEKFKSSIQWNLNPVNFFAVERGKFGSFVSDQMLQLPTQAAQYG